MIYRTWCSVAYAICLHTPLMWWRHGFCWLLPYAGEHEYRKESQ